MKIAIIGAGNVGGALGGGWAAAGHDITFGVRDPDDSKTSELIDSSGGRAQAKTVPEACADSDVIVLAVPWSAAEDAVTSAGPLRGKVLIDATNPLEPDLSGLTLGRSTSAAEQVAAWSNGARVVKAFNTIGAQHMRGSRFGDQQATMFVCGDDDDAKAIAIALAQDLDFDGVDAGPLTQARLLEPLAMLWISMAYLYGYGPDIAFRLLRT